MRLFSVQKASLAAAAAAVLTLTAPIFAVAADMSSPAPIDCSQTSAMMDQAQKAPPPAMTGDVDHDTMMMMKMHSTMAMQMARVEAACGKDPKKKAAAAKMLEDSTELFNEINRLTSPNG